MTMKTYSEVESQILDEIKQIASETEVPIEKVFAIRQATRAKAVVREREEMAAKNELGTERAAALEKLPDVLAPFRTNGTWPKARQIIDLVGLPPTKSHIGWLTYQLRLAAPTAQAAE